MASYKGTFDFTTPAPSRGLPTTLDRRTLGWYSPITGYHVTTLLSRYTISERSCSSNALLRQAKGLPEHHRSQCSTSARHLKQCCNNPAWSSQQRNSLSEPEWKQSTTAHRARTLKWHWSREA